MVNRMPGMPRGPIDHNASSVINAISNGSIDMGSVVIMALNLPLDEFFPRVREKDNDQGNILVYGVVVNGEVKGIFGDGSASIDDSTRATNDQSQSVIVVTRGRCLGRVRGSVNGVNAGIGIGEKLTMSSVNGVMEGATTGDFVIATSLNSIASGDLDMVAVDVSQQGKF